MPSDFTKIDWDERVRGWARSEAMLRPPAKGQRVSWKRGGRRRFGYVDSITALGIYQVRSKPGGMVTSLRPNEITREE